MRDHDIFQLRIPGIFPAAHLEYARQIGIEPEPLLRAAGLAPSIEALAENGLTYAGLEKLIGPAGLQRLHSNEDFGFRTGWEVPVTSFGHLGYAMMCSASVGDALNLAMRYWDLIGRTLQMEIREEANYCVLRFELEVPATGLLRRWIFEAALTSVCRGMVSMVPALSDVLELSFDLSAAAHAKEMRNSLGPIRFDAPYTSLRFPKDILKQTLPLSSAAGLRQAEALCAEQLKRLYQPETTTTRVKRYLNAHYNNFAAYPTLDMAAEHLHISSRTLRRRLAEEQSGYAAILEETRRQDAMQLLEDKRLSVAEVARRLGYEDPANFTRAFRQWLGITPSEWRESRSA